MQQDTVRHRRFSSLVGLLPYLLIGTVAILLRVPDLGGYLTVDEATTWVPNSYRFLRVLQSGHYEATPFMGHPAITTMWLGTAGVVLRRALFDWGILTHETYPLVLALNRLPTALVNAGGIVLGYGVLRRLFPPTVALLAALLWAADPFIVAFSRVLHMDALMGMFATLSLLAAYLFWYRRAGRRWLVISAVCAGLAVLSKLPSLLLFPMVGGLALSLEIGRQQAEEWKHIWAWSTVSRLLLPLLVWGVLCGATVVALWPTFWTNPVRAYEALRYGVEVEGGNPHLEGNFFMGREDPQPGLVFYPVALVMRMTPWVMVGVLLLPLARSKRWGTEPDDAQPTRQQHSVESPLLILLIAWVLLFMAGMSLFPLKFNRYLVPTFPVVDTLGAVGLVWLSGRAVLVGRRWLHSSLPSSARFALAALVMLVALVNAAWYHPYSIVYFNQALGGTTRGARVFLVGWGEGLDQVTDWLNQQPDIRSVVTVSRLDTLLNPFLRKLAHAERARGVQLPNGAGYMVIYYRHVQWGQEPPPYSDFYGHAIPLHTVTLHGVDYAWIYQVPRGMPENLQADYGASVQMQGYGVDTSAVRSSGTLTLSVQWHALAPIPETHQLFVHVLDKQGQRVAQVDVPLKTPHDTPATWEPGRFVVRVYPLSLPPRPPRWRLLDSDRHLQS